MFTRTRAPEGGFADVDFVVIGPDPDTDEGGITTGEIRTVAGSGKMAVSPQTVEKDSGNNRFTLTYTAATDLTDATLEIVAPEAVTTDLSDSRAKDGYVSAPSASLRKLDPAEGTEKLEVEGDTITWNGLNLKAGQTFVTVIVRVTLSDVTGDGYEWRASLGLAAIGTTRDAVSPVLIDR